jgi:hypothetical protein
LSVEFRNVSHFEHFVRGFWLRYHWLNGNGWLALTAFVMGASFAFSLLELGPLQSFTSGLGAVYVAALMWDRLTHWWSSRRVIGLPPFDPGDPSGDRFPRRPGPRDPAGTMARPEPLTADDDEEFVASH